jgi:phage baseplate assembly protein W
MRLNKSFLGIGWKFPPTFDKESGSIMLVSEAEDIKESLEIILSTRKGERVMLADFGCDLHHLAFEAVNGNMIGRLRTMIIEAIAAFEPRITLIDTIIDQSRIVDGFLIVTLEYIINSSNTSSNMVFPYYLMEGSNVRFKPLTDS